MNIDITKTTTKMRPSRQHASPRVFVCFCACVQLLDRSDRSHERFTRLLLAELARGKEQSQQHLDSLEDQINALRLTFGLLSVGFSAFASLSDQIGLSILFSRSIRTQMDVIFLLIRA